MSRCVVEALETRQLFAGVTILATGWKGGLDGWMLNVAEDMTTRLGGPSQVPRYILNVHSNEYGQLETSLEHVNGTAHANEGNVAEVIFEIDYYTISTLTQYGLGWISDTITNYMMTTPVDGVRLAEFPIHEIGVSRGTGLI